MSIESMLIEEQRILISKLREKAMLLEEINSTLYEQIDLLKKILKLHNVDVNDINKG